MRKTPTEEPANRQTGTSPEVIVTRTAVKLKDSSIETVKNLMANASTNTPPEHVVKAMQTLAAAGVPARRRTTDS